MEIPHTFVGIVYLISGFAFATNSSMRGDGATHWGYALTGIVSLVIAARFLGMPLNRDASKEKTVKPDPLA